MSSIQIHGKKMRLRVLAQQWNKATNKAQAERILLKIKALLGQLQGWIQRKEVYQILGAAALALGLGGNMQAQQFAPPVTNPFGFSPNASLYYLVPSFIDWDNDGDFDIISHDYYFRSYFFENIGTPGSPRFSTAEVNQFGLQRTTDSFGPATQGDIDNDGDLDILVGNTYYGNLEFFENTGTPEQPQFASGVENPFGIESFFLPGDYGFPEWVDLDADGDLDLLFGQVGAGFLFFENIGTPENPNYDRPQSNPYGLTQGEEILNTIAVGDLDGDGDYDLISVEGLYDGYYILPRLKYFENIGSSSNPNFAEPVRDPFGINNLGYYAFFTDLVDIDNDGDIDLFTGEYYGELTFYENTTIISVEEPIAQLEINLFPNPASAELHIKGLEQTATFQVLDAVGKQLLYGQYDGIQPISLNTLKPGVYMLSLDVDGQTVRKTFTKQ